MDQKIPSLSPFDPQKGTFANSFPDPGPALTLDALNQARQKIEAAGPPPPSEITVSPDLEDALRDALAPPSGPRPTGTPPTAILAALPAPGAFRIHIDERLPPRTWHPGKPRR